MWFRFAAFLVACSFALNVGCTSSEDDTPTDPTPPSPLVLSQYMMVVDYFDDGGSFTIENTGSSTVSWTASSNQVWLTLSAASGDLDGGQTVPVTLTIARGGLATGQFTARVTVTDDASSGVSLNVTVRNYAEDLDIAEFLVIDAEYDDASDSWVVVSAGPSQLHVVDASAKTAQSVSLSVLPQCVSVRPDGAYAAVGHNAWITRVDLSPLTAETPVQITTDANDIVLAPTDYAYVFPRGTGWDNVRSVALPAGTETQDPQQTFTDMIARLHPVRSEIYAADTGVSPSDVWKFDVSSGTAAIMYDSQYHGDYAFYGNLWFTNDGAKFLARGGNVFSTSTVQVDDIIYAGAVAGVDLVEWADQSAVTDKWYVCHTNWSDDYSNEIRVYEGAFFQYESSILVPDAPVVTGPFDIDWEDLGARYCAVSSDGAKLHVIAMRLDVEEWYFASFDLP